MNGNYLLDSNAIIDYLRGNNKSLLDLMEKKNVAVPVIVVGELYYGAENSTQIKKHLTQIEAFITSITIIDVTFETSKIYGSIRTKLKKLGKPIPENDIWIAAIALQNESVLITNDHHFKNIKNLKTISI
uniref:type II toxin-antitoxin system VapC family toxin n=1 Tax=Flavobacterium sp. TaxID=239 RepID=UPI00404AFC28